MEPLTQYKSADEFAKALGKMDVTVGWLGGRKFVTESGIEYKMDDLVRRLDAFSKESPTPGLKKAFQNVQVLDAKSRYKSWWNPFSRIRQALGGLVSNRQQTLDTISEMVDKIQISEKKLPTNRIEKNLQLAKTQMKNEEAKGFSAIKEATSKVSSAHEVQVGEHRAGFAETKGSRFNMQDTHLLQEIKFRGTPIQLFGVFDGFGGSETSQFVKDRLPSLLKENLEIYCKESLSDETVFMALKDVFERLHRESPTTPSGTEACVAIKIGDRLYLANVGDSRALLAHGAKATQLTEDARLDIDRYQKKVEGTIQPFRSDGPQFVGRKLPYARAIGYKEKGVYVPPRPKITAVDVPKGSHLVLGTKGLFDVASTREVADAVENTASSSTSEIAQDLVVGALENGAEDNVTALVVEF